MGWLVDHYEFVTLALVVAFLVLTVIIRVTPTKKDDQVLDRVLELLELVRSSRTELPDTTADRVLRILKENGKPKGPSPISPVNSDPDS